jgi:F0F1-type ATP synthase delta subunit
MSWISDLPSRLRLSLNSLLDRVEQHEEIYDEAENPSVGQIWVAMAMMNKRMERLEDMVQAQRKALNELDRDVDVDSHLDKNLEESLKKY